GTRPYFPVPATSNLQPATGNQQPATSNQIGLQKREQQQSFTASSSPSISIIPKLN
ncbi:unnamed protein product, partial [Ilex paraguariensis]